MSETLSPLRRRSIHRWAHLLLATALGVYLYSPLGAVSQAETLVQFVLFPGLVGSGLLLWKGSAVRRWYRTRGAAGD